MPWMESTAMTQRRDFVALARSPQANVAGLCRRFGIRRSTAYKWIARYLREGPDGLTERSRRPHSSPCQVGEPMAELIGEIRRLYGWGGRKIQALLDGAVEGTPAPSTITNVLRRAGQLDTEESRKHSPTERFERPQPNDLWQMDFKGDFPLRQGRCYPLTILDDHSRFNVALKACSCQRAQPVQTHLIQAFHHYGLPWQMLCDNGPPWAAGGGGFTHLSAWLIRLGITVLHGRPFHPQTQGKDERFHRSLKAEVLRRQPMEDPGDAQECFDRWRQTYNHVRPHEALDMQTPSQHYRASERPYPTVLPAIEYGSGDQVRKVGANGRIRWQRRSVFVSEAFAGESVALRPTECDGLLHVYYCHQKVARIDLRGHNVD